MSVYFMSVLQAIQKKLKIKVRKKFSSLKYDKYCSCMQLRVNGSDCLVFNKNNNSAPEVSVAQLENNYSKDNFNSDNVSINLVFRKLVHGNIRCSGIQSIAVDADIDYLFVVVQDLRKLRLCRILNFSIEVPISRH